MKFAGNKLRDLRTARGWDQATLAAKAGLGKTVISYLESGRTEYPRPTTVAALAGALGCHQRDLYKRTRRVTPPPAAKPAEPAPPVGVAEPLPLFAGPAAPARAQRRRVTPEVLEALPGWWRRLFTGCLGQGFTEDQALRLVCAFIGTGA